MRRVMDGWLVGDTEGWKRNTKKRNRKVERKDVLTEKGEGHKKEPGIDCNKKGIANIIIISEVFQIPAL